MLDALADLLRKGEAMPRTRSRSRRHARGAPAPDIARRPGRSVHRASDRAEGAPQAARRPRTSGALPTASKASPPKPARIRERSVHRQVLVRAFDQAADRLITLPFGVHQCRRRGYLYGLPLPSLFFHVATALRPSCATAACRSASAISSAAISRAGCCFFATSRSVFSTHSSPCLMASTPIRFVGAMHPAQGVVVQRIG